MFPKYFQRFNRTKVAKCSSCCNESEQQLQRSGDVTRIFLYRLEKRWKLGLTALDFVFILPRTNCLTVEFWWFCRFRRTCGEKPSARSGREYHPRQILRPIRRRALHWICFASLLSVTYMAATHHFWDAEMEDEDTVAHDGHFRKQLTMLKEVKVKC